MAKLGENTLGSKLGAFAKKVGSEKQAALAKTEAGRFDPKAALATQEGAIKSQFAGARRRLGGQQQEAGRQIDQSANRLAARVGQTGGAIEKAKLGAITDTAQKFGDVEATLTGQESGAIAQAQQAAGTQQLQKESLDFQRDSFAQQMSLMLDQFDEDKKNSFFNTVLAFEQSAIDNDVQLQRVLEGIKGLQGDPNQFATPQVRAQVNPNNQGPVVNPFNRPQGA